MYKAWEKLFLHRLGYVKRKATTKASILNVDFEVEKEQFEPLLKWKIFQMR